MSHRLLPIIEEAIGNAAENGYVADLDRLTDEQLASDMYDCCGALDQELFEDILAAVREFRAAQAV